MSRSNEEASERLAALLARLSDADLDRDLGSGWTVTTALGHLAFWDRKQALTLAAWQASGPQPFDDDSVNEALEPILGALQGRAAAELALASARELDAAIAAAPVEVREAIASSAHGYITARFVHRDEHVEQIERALS